MVRAPLTALSKALLSLTLCATWIGCADTAPDEVTEPLERVDLVIAPAEAPSLQVEQGLTPSPVRATRLQRKLQQLIDFQGGVDAFILPDSDDFASIPQDPLNPITAEKVALGKLLFHETGMGVENLRPEGYQTYSCSTCHHSAAGFQADSPQGIGEGGEGLELRLKRPSYLDSELDVQPIRTPTTLNTAYQDVMVWNGQFGGTGTNAGTEYAWTQGTPKAINHLGFQGLESQAIAAQDVHRLTFEGSPLVNNAQYKQLFDAAFGHLPQNQRMTDRNAGLAIAAFERTTFTNQAPWQKWLKGQNSALTEREVRGAILFFGRAQCSSCHYGPALNSMTFYALGMNDLDTAIGPVHGVGLTAPDRLGRGGFTGKLTDFYTFKTPQLYNLADSPFYGHGASMNTIREVLEYKTNGVAENGLVQPRFLSPEFQPLGLTSSQLNDLEAFITNALYDPNLDRYEPATLPSGLCPIAADPETKQERGCN